jgi:protein involved in polysaccharide export with SLBB domain
MSGEFVVGAGGDVAFPFVGPVPAADLSLAAFEQALKARLADGFLKQPQVSVSLSASQKRRVFVAGMSAGAACTSTGSSRMSLSFSGRLHLRKV